MKFQSEKKTFGGFVTTEASMKSFILTWYLLIIYGHAQCDGRQIDDDTENPTSTATLGLVDLRTDHNDFKIPETISVSRGNCLTQ